ncbi:DNA cytosine methyltransferase [Ligilactobacillus acidipiscis]|uniref:DNA cytosine methyltransferase n=1 Tax=Ligilactobacillus acidipiscis TaxID=89059 RepID=UPI003868C691
MISDDLQDVLSTTEVAKKIKCSNQFVRNLIKSGNLKAKQVGRTFIITKKDLIEWLESSSFVIEPDDHPRKSNEVPHKVALSFFTGAGGLDLGMLQAGIKPILVNEIDKYARKSISKNFPEAGLVGDVNNLTVDKIYEYANVPKNTPIDYVFGGPPCQAFSTAGKRRGYKDSRGDVFIKYLNLIGQLKPRYVVIENVRGLLSVPILLSEKDGKGIKGGVLFYALKKLQSFGYAVSFNLYNAANFGAPEIRERVVIIAKRGNEKVNYLQPTNEENGFFNLPKWKTLGEAIEGLDKKQNYVEYPHKRFKYLKFIPEGGNWRSLPIKLQKEAMGKSYYLPGGKTGFLRRLSMAKPAPTLVTHPTMPATDLIHPRENRPLSVEEYSRIQGFPDDWYIEGSLLEKYKQIGNAVPVPLGKAIGERILKDEAGIKEKVPKEFKFSRYKNTDEETWEKQALIRIKEGTMDMDKLIKIIEKI